MRGAGFAVPTLALMLFTACGEPTTPPLAVALKVGSAPTGGYTDVPLGTLSVDIVDQNGNLVPQSTATITVAFGSNPPQAALRGVLSVNAVDGRAVFRTLTVSKPGSGYSLTVSGDGLTAATSQQFSVAAGTRTMVDRLDDVTDAQVHAVYVLPSDGVDRYLDLNGAIALSVASFRTWFQQASGGLNYRFDTFGGELDVTFFRMSQTDAVIKGAGAFVRNRIEDELRDAGRLKSNKLYIAYYDGGSTYACGGASWPPNVPGQLAAMYLKGTPGGGSCPTQLPTIGGGGFPGYWEFAMLHDLTHTLGIVSTNAPHHTALYPAHVPEANDLMFTGPSAWILNATTAIDIGGDDYHGPAVAPGLPRLTASPFLFGVVANPFSPLGSPSALEEVLLAAQVKSLPMHEPLVPRPR